MSPGSILKELIQNLLRHPAQKVTGNQPVSDPAEIPLYAVMKASLAMAMSVYHLLSAIFFRYVREAASFFKDVRRRVMQKHNKFSKTVPLCLLKGAAETVQFPADQLF